MTTRKALTFTPPKPVLMKYWVSYNEMGAVTPAMKMKAKEREGKGENKVTNRRVKTEII